MALLPTFVTAQTKFNAVLNAGKSTSGTLNAGQSIKVDLNVLEGDYVRGSFNSASATLSLDSEKDQHFRLLGKGTGERENFYFIVEDDQHWHLTVNAVTDGEYSIEIASIITASDQHTPVEQPESPWLRELIAKLERGGGTKAFWKQIQRRGTPLVEYDSVEPPLNEDEALVTFLYRGANERVQVFAAPSGDHDEMRQLLKSDVWYASYRVPRTARICYKIAPDVPDLNATFWDRRRAILATAQLDPLNPNSFPADPIDRFNGESILELPDAPKQPWLQPSPNTPAGEICSHRFKSDILGNTRNVHLYRPAGYKPFQEANALLVIFDGERYLNDIEAPQVLDRLIEAKKIPSTAAIFIGNPSQASRSKELPCNPDFAKFLAEELIPWAEEQKVSASKSNTIAVGASYGGLAAAYAAFKYPEIFGNAFCQSGSFWWSPGAAPGSKQSDPQWLTQQFVDAEPSGTNFYLEAGLFEDHGRTSILRSTRHLRDVLRARGFDVQLHEHASGHGYYYWRYTFPDGLSALLGSDRRFSP